MCFTLSVSTWDQGVFAVTGPLVYCTCFRCEAFLVLTIRLSAQATLPLCAWSMDSVCNLWAVSVALDASTALHSLLLDSALSVNSTFWSRWSRLSGADCVGSCFMTERAVKSGSQPAVLPSLKDSQDQIALVVGDVEDVGTAGAATVARRLQELGFYVQRGNVVGDENIETGFDAFVGSLRPGCAAVVYFRGVLQRSDDETDYHLMPVNFGGSNASGVWRVLFAWLCIRLLCSPWNRDFLYLAFDAELCVSLRRWVHRAHGALGSDDPGVTLSAPQSSLCIMIDALDASSGLELNCVDLGSLRPPYNPRYGFCVIVRWDGSTCTLCLRCVRMWRSLLRRVEVVLISSRKETFRHSMMGRQMLEPAFISKSLTPFAFNWAHLISVANAWSGRTALVIGISSYAEMLNRKVDFDLDEFDPRKFVASTMKIAARLGGLGFVVSAHTNLDSSGMEAAFEEFCAGLAFAGTAIVYFAGLGWQEVEDEADCRLIPSDGGDEWGKHLKVA
jgi:hypothetical protein